MDEDIKTKRTMQAKKIMGCMLEAEPGTGWKTEQRGRRVKNGKETDNERLSFDLEQTAKQAQLNKSSQHKV